MSDAENVKHFQLTIHPQPKDFDELGHVNNVVYLQWVQDVAEAHWKSIREDETLDNLIWVALRHEIDYKREIKPSEAVVAETFVASMEGVKSERITKIFNPETKQIKAEARTFWCLLNAKTKKPMRIDQPLKELFI